MDNYIRVLCNQQLKEGSTGSSLDIGKEQILVLINHLSVVKEKHLKILKLDEDCILNGLN